MAKRLEAVAVFKEYNLRRHYESRHKDKYDSLQGQMRADKLSKLKSGLSAQQNTFVRQAQLNQSSVRASFRVAQLIASSGKPFTDGEFVKKCMNAVAKEVCPEKEDVFNAASLSASTITRRIEEIGGNVYAQLQQKAKEFNFFSLALDESTDVQDTAQLLIFIRGVSANFEMCEELAALQSLKGTTTGEDIFGKVCQTMEELDLDWSKLASITTDGAPSMVENPAAPFPAEKCVEALEMLKAQFGVRFRKLHVNAKEIRLFQNPFVADIDEAQPSYQFELAELQNCDVLKDAFKPNSLIDFYAALPNDTQMQGHSSH
ncbi:hypothetical protein VZT92_014420 [Zoarces viviparus]|uniref:DUF4371 domain-containing protein n=1 Tax=Zoarces viviparus TaxID=48416 RepID=A0AAW1EZS9_ZOAVI